MKSPLQSLPYSKMRHSLNQFSALNDNDWMLLQKELRMKHYKKGDFFVKEDQICTTIGFLNQGIARAYYQIDGKEITSYFNAGTRNTFVGSFTSFISRKPSFENVHFLEDTELLLLEYDQLQQLYENSAGIQQMGRIIAEYNYVLSMERIYSLQHDSALKRYNDMLKIYPGLLNQIPHHYIASYLGITPESLSRVRKESLKKKL